MSNIEKAFDAMFGSNKDDFGLIRDKSPKQNRANLYHRPKKSSQRLSTEQKRFCSFLSLDTYKDKYGNMRQELIVQLVQRDGRVVVEELRRPDFSVINKYRQHGVEQPINGIMPISGDWDKMSGYDGDGYYRFAWRFVNHTGNECEIHIDKTHPLRKLQAKDVIDCLHRTAMDMNAGVAGQLSKLHDTLDKQLQEAGEDVFIYELLQNANDYPYCNEEVDRYNLLFNSNSCLFGVC